jgi:hypothetical protein
VFADGREVIVVEELEAAVEEEADARRAIVRILNRDPYDVWTRDSLARSIGMPASLIDRILGQLASAGIVHRTGSDADAEYSVAAEPY